MLLTLSQGITMGILVAAATVGGWGVSENQIRQNRNCPSCLPERPLRRVTIGGIRTRVSILTVTYSRRSPARAKKAC